MIKDIPFILAAPDTYSEWATVPFNKYDFWRILEATGTVTVQFGEDMPERSRKKGGWGILMNGEKIARVRCKSSVAETVTVTVGDEREGDLAYFNTAGGATNVLNTPVGPDLMVAPNGVTLYPFRTNDALNLGVGGILTVVGDIGNNAEIDTSQVSLLRLVVNAGSTGDYVTALDLNSLSAPPLPILDVNGNLARSDGRLYFDNTFSPAGTTYYIDVSGIQRVKLSPGVGAPYMKAYAYPLGAAPSPKGKRRVILTATDLGVTVGAYAAPAADILTTASIKARLAALGFTPSKMELMLSLTPGGSGADTFFLEYKKTLSGVVSQRLSINTYVSTTTGLATSFVSYNSGQNMGQVFGLNAAAAGVAPAAAGNMVIPFDDISFILRKSTPTNVGVINNISLLLEE